MISHSFDWPPTLECVQAGVCPSPGAAGSANGPASKYCSAPGRPALAAPGDGRTPHRARFASNSTSPLNTSSRLFPSRARASWAVSRPYLTPITSRCNGVQQHLANNESPLTNRSCHAQSGFIFPAPVQHAKQRQAGRANGCFSPAPHPVEPLPSRCGRIGEHLRVSAASDNGQTGPLIFRKRIFVFQSINPAILRR